MNEPDFVVEEWERDLSAHVARPLAFEALAGLIGRNINWLLSESPLEDGKPGSIVQRFYRFKVLEPLNL